MHVPDDKNHPLTLLFICRCIQVHGDVQPNKTPWIHPLGTLFSPWGPETTLCPLSHHVPGHFDGKSAHHLGYPLWSSAPKPNVFLPEHLVLCWYLLHNSYSPQDVSELFIREKDHFLCWMSGADVFLPSLWKHGQLPPGSHGHWPLCSYLQPLALCPCYEPWTLHVATGLLHSFLLPSLPPACPPGESAHFLCIKCYPSLFLWCQPCSEAGLLFYLCQWSCRHDRRAGFCDGPICLHRHLLPENPHCGPQNSLSCWKMQSLLHLQLPCHCGDSLLCEYLLCLFPAIVQLHCQRLNSNGQLHCADTNVEPIYLQLKKQRHERGLREIDKQD